jgi:hypothetical protein
MVLPPCAGAKAALAALLVTQPPLRMAFESSTHQIEEFDPLVCEQPQDELRYG